MKKNPDKIFTRKFFQKKGKEGGNKNIELHGTKRMKEISQKGVEAKKMIKK